jgi:hypothetical protein
MKDSIEETAGGNSPFMAAGERAADKIIDADIRPEVELPGDGRS